MSGSMDLANNNIINAGDVHATSISSPLSPDVLANNQPIVIQTTPTSQSPSTSAGANAVVPITEKPIQIGPSTFSQGGIVFYGQDSVGAALARDAETASMGEYGALPHELPCNDPPGKPAQCSDFHLNGDGLLDSDYMLKISQHFILRQLCVNSNIVSQLGLTAKDIGCNLKALAVNVLDPVWNHQQFRINSGFRSLAHNLDVAGSAKNSDHLTGAAADITTGTTEGDIALFKWIISSGIPFSCIIYESGVNTKWIHIAFNGHKHDGTGSLSRDTRCMWKPIGQAYQWGGYQGEKLPPELRP